jgi:hypothetical protein
MNGSAMRIHFQVFQRPGYAPGLILFNGFAFRQAFHGKDAVGCSRQCICRAFRVAHPHLADRVGRQLDQAAPQPLLALAGKASKNSLVR